MSTVQARKWNQVFVDCDFRGKHDVVMLDDPNESFIVPISTIKGGQGRRYHVPVPNERQPSVAKVEYFEIVAVPPPHKPFCAVTLKTIRATLRKEFRENFRDKYIGRMTTYRSVSVIELFKIDAHSVVVTQDFKKLFTISHDLLPKWKPGDLAFESKKLTPLLLNNFPVLQKYL